MAYSVPSVEIKPPTGGQRTDVATYSIPEESAAVLRNIVNRHGLVRSRPGYVAHGTTLGAYPTGVFQYMHHDGTQKIVGATKAKWYRWDFSGNDWDDITPGGNPLTGADGSHQIFRVFYMGGATYLLGVNGHSDDPIYWDGTTSDYADIGGSPGNAKTMCVLAGRVLMGNFNNAPYKVDVSDFNDFTSGWGSTQVVQLADTPGDIVAMQEFGSLVAYIYKSDAIYQVAAVAALYPFQFNLKFAGIPGPMSPRCVIPTPKAHIVLANDCQIYSFDGTSYTPAGEHVRSFLSSDMNLGRMEFCHGFYHAEFNEVWFFYAGAGIDTPDSAVILKLDDASVWPLKWDTLRCGAAGQFLMEDDIVIGDMVQPLSYYTSPLSNYSSRQQTHLFLNTSGQVYKKQGFTDAGSAIPVEIKSGMRMPSEDAKFVTVVETQNYIKKTSGSQDLDLQLLHSDSEYLQPTEETARTFDLGIAGPKVSGHRVSSRFFGLKYTGDLETELVFEGGRIYGAGRGLR